jgi:trimeric autotransporter adhesin
MKASFLFLFCILFSLGSVAQRISGTVKGSEQVNSGSRTLETIPPGVFFFEGFDNVLLPNLPSGWTTYSSGSQAFITGTSGNLSGQTNENGFWPVPFHGLYAFTNDDVCNCDKSFDLLTSKSFDLSKQVYVRLGFSAFQNGSGGQSVSVQLKTETGSWTSVETIPTNAEWKDQSINIPAKFLGKGFQFRFKYDDNGNYASGFAVDDIYMSVQPDDRLSMESFYTSSEHQLGSGYIPSLIPIGQAIYADLEFDALTSNQALADKNLRLTVDVTGPHGFSDTSGSWLISPLETKIIGVPNRNTFTPFDTGFYVLETQIQTDSVDSDLGDNSFSTSFTVTDSVYQRFLEPSDGTGIWMLDTFDRAGSVFEIYHQDSIISTWIGIHPTTDIGARFRIKIFNFDTLTASIFSTSPVQVQETELGSFKRIAIGKILAPGKYLIVVEQELNRLVLTSSNAKLSPDGISYYQPSGGSWSNLAYLPYIQIVFPEVDEACPGHLQARIQDESCPESNDGTIKIEAHDMNLQATYSWSNGAGNVDSIGSLEPGPYEVFATDGAGCIYNRVFNIAASDTLTLNPIIALDTCSAGVGVVQLNVTGAHPPYQISWNGTPVPNEKSGLDAGVYSVEIINDLGCSQDTNLVIDGTEPLNIAIGVSNSGCGSSNGDLIATAIGTGPFAFIWNTGDSTNVIDSLGSGLYYLTVSDSIGCTSTVTAILSDSNAPAITGSDVVDNECSGSLDGSVSITAVGSSQLDYFWNNGETSSTISGLLAGNYVLTISDSLGCQTYGAFDVLDESLPFEIDLMDIGIQCFGVNSGSILALPIGGTPPYNYQWSNGQTGATEIQNLNEGSYSVTVTDNKGCVLSNESELFSQPQFFLIIDSIKTDTNGVTKLDGEINLSTYGGTPPYSYKWNNGERTEDLIGIDTGYYSLTIKDQLGCALSFEKYLRDDPLSTEKIIGNTELVIYPNPLKAGQPLTIQSTSDILSVHVFSIDGKRVNVWPSSVSEHTIDESGIYILSISLTNGQTRQVKLLVF